MMMMMMMMTCVFAGFAKTHEWLALKHKTTKQPYSHWHAGLNLQGNHCFFKCVWSKPVESLASQKPLQRGQSGPLGGFALCPGSPMSAGSGDTEDV